MPLQSDRMRKLPEPAGISPVIVRQDEVPADFARLQMLARLMDNAVQIPGTSVRVGLDGLLGLIPGAGDTASALVSVFILSEARRLGIPRLTLHRMAANVLLDAVVGTVPFAGDVFDVYWKANHRNVELLKRHLESSGGAQAPTNRRSDWLFFAGLIALLIAIIALGVTVIYTVLRFLFAG